MKKMNKSGFVLAETLIVTVFLMLIFTMIYSNFYPLVGEYEKRESYDDVDGKYAVYWIKRLIEDASYQVGTDKVNNMREYGFIRFECSDIDDDDKRDTCIYLLRDLEVDGCDQNGRGCSAFITKYQLGGDSGTSNHWFKDTVTSGMVRYQENCSGASCKNQYVDNCILAYGSSNSSKCSTQAEKKLFKSGFQDYVFSLPDYSTASLNYANYRVLVVFHHNQNNNYYSYATIEVNK